MRNSIVGDGILERLRDVTLSNHLLKTLRSPLSSQNQIGHQRILDLHREYSPFRHSSGTYEISEKGTLRCSKHFFDHSKVHFPPARILEYPNWMIGRLVIKTKKLINSFSSSKPIIPVFHYSNIPCGLFPTFHHSM
jgi:hypothetical protein